MDKQNPHLLLRVPTPNQQKLSFCDSTPRDLKRWIAGLPKANLGETARQLYQCLVELNQLITPAENRLQLLELLRAEVYFVSKHLEKHFLAQAIVLDERPRKVANLCQALENHLAAGYKLIVAQEAPRNSRERNQLQLLTIAIQRAAHCLCGPLIRASQLYCPVPEGLWLELHKLYQIAQNSALQTIVVRDDMALHTKGLSVEQTYLIALLLGCARTNQMRQSGIARLSEVLGAWSSLVHLQAADEPSSLFAVPSQVDGPPRYKSLFHDNELPSLLGIDPQPLVDAIKEHLMLAPDNRSESRLLIPEGMSIDLLQHLSSAWGDIAERTFQRNAGHGSLNLCLGMSALHFFLAGGKPFNEVLKRPEERQTATFKAISPDAKDVWRNAFDAKSGLDWNAGIPHEEIQYQRPAGDDDTGVAAENGYPTFELPIVNHSPGGYCLSWPKEVPTQLQAGELLGVQDSPEQSWSVALVRWIRQVRGGGTQMGIELVAPHAQPCGLQLLRKADQSSQYLRALLLPEISAISRPATLITARLPFQEGNKVQINLNGEERRAVLSRKQTSTGSFNQFEYRAVELTLPEQGKPVTPQKKQGASGEEDFDSLWKSL